MLLIPLDADYTIPLRRAPDVHEACTEAYGAGEEPSVVSLRELLGLIGAHEWRKKGSIFPRWAVRAFTRITVSFHRCAANMSIWSRKRHCRRKHWRSTSARAPACSLPFLRNAA